MWLEVNEIQLLQTSGNCQYLQIWHTGVLIKPVTGWISNFVNTDQNGREH